MYVLVEGLVMMFSLPTGDISFDLWPPNQQQNNKTRK